MDASSITAIGVIFTGLVSLFLKFVSDNRKSQEKRDEVFAKNLEANTKAMNLVARATKKQADEAAQRNGHLAELAIENTQATLEAIAAIKSPTIKEQHVELQTIEKSKVTKQTGGK